MRCCLHIGLHKTGTTSFQSSCAKSREALRRAGIFYPDGADITRGIIQHLGLAVALRNGDADAAFAMLDQARLSAPESPTMLISSEALNTEFAMRPDAARQLIAKCETVFDAVEIHLTVRNQAEMFRSMILQNIAGSGFPENPDKTFSKILKGQFEKYAVIKEVSGDRLRVHRYEDFSQAAYCSEYLAAVTGIDVSIPTSGGQQYSLERCQGVP